MREGRTCLVPKESISACPGCQSLSLVVHQQMQTLGDPGNQVLGPRRNESLERCARQATETSMGASGG